MRNEGLSSSTVQNSNTYCLNLILNDFMKSKLMLCKIFN